MVLDESICSYCFYIDVLVLHNSGSPNRTCYQNWPRPCLKKSLGRKQAKAAAFGSLRVVVFTPFSYNYKIFFIFRAGDFFGDNLSLFKVCSSQSVGCTVVRLIPSSLFPGRVLCCHAHADGLGLCSLRPVVSTTTSSSVFPAPRRNHTHTRSYTQQRCWCSSELGTVLSHRRDVCRCDDEWHLEMLVSARRCCMAREHGVLERRGIKTS